MEQSLARAHKRSRDDNHTNPAYALGLSIDVPTQWAIDAVAYGGWGAIGEPGPLAVLRLGIRDTPRASSSAPQEKRLRVKDLSPK